MLKLWAYFDNREVWFELIQHASLTDDKWIQKLAKDKLSFNQAIRLLCEYGLAQPEPSLGQQHGSTGYGMHSCMHSWTRSVLNNEWDDGLARLALTCVASEIPKDYADNWWLLEQRLLQHVARLKKFIMTDKIDSEGMHRAIYYLGSLYLDQGKLVEAEAMFVRALQGHEETFGRKHPWTLVAVQNLGVVYMHQGKLAEAEAMHDRALQGYEETLGRNHLSTLYIVDCLGSVYLLQGRLAEAEAMSDQVLQDYEETLGPKHLSTLDAVTNLGLFYKIQGKLEEAEAMYNLALQGKEELLGPTHVSTLGVLSSLGMLYRDQDKLVEAEAIYDRALQGFEKALGPELAQSHLAALSTMWAFGNLLYITDREDKAKLMYARALAGYTMVQGPSSKSCKLLRDHLKMMEAAFPGPQAAFPRPEDETAKSRELASKNPSSLKRMVRKFGKFHAS